MNQCMGCQAGWPLTPTRDRHAVVGGYPGEGVACTRARYENPNPIQTTNYCELCSARLGAQNPGTICDSCKVMP